MNYFRQEKCLRDQERYLMGFAAIAGEGIARGGSINRRIAPFVERGWLEMTPRRGAAEG
jgi:hypothetical protein